jgi:phage terminase large subunit-like protein
VMITTQSEEAPVGIMKSELQLARNVRDGKLQTPTLPVLYEFPEAMQKDKQRPWRDSGNWHMVTPNAGRSITVKRLVAECEVAETKGEAELRAWASQHLNIEIGLALRSDSWAGAEFWEQQAVTGLTLEEVLRRSDVLEIGVDGGGLDDLLGLTALGRDPDTGEWLHWARGYAHVSVLERRKSEAPLLLDLQAAGHLVLCEEFGQDVVLVGDIVEQCEGSGLLDKIGVDPSGIGSIVDEITGRGIELERIVGVSQGWRLVGAIKTAERKLSEKKLVHEGSPLMAWCVGNAKVVPSGNAVLITKQASGTGKIDPLMSTFNAVELMSRNPQARRSFWDQD